MNRKDSVWNNPNKRFKDPIIGDIYCTYIIPIQYPIPILFRQCNLTCHYYPKFSLRYFADSCSSI